MICCRCVLEGFHHGAVNGSVPKCMHLPEQVHKAKLLAPGKWQGAPQNGVVAVKVQYPDALQTMLQDLSNVRVAANFLQVWELLFMHSPDSGHHLRCGLEYVA